MATKKNKENIIKIIEINPSLADQQEIVIQAEKLRASLSPYDIPQTVTTTYDEINKVFLFDLKYLTPDEPKIEDNINDNIVLILGKNSRKIYGGKIKAERKGQLPGISLIIIGAINRLLENITDDRPSIQKMNYGLIKKFLEEEKSLY